MSKTYYVYVYYDPRNGSPIYVGMGKGNRAFKHWKKKANNTFLQNVLDKIRAEGLSPRIEFAAMDLFKDEANSLEAELIALYGRRDLCKGTLTNLTDGGDGAKGLRVTDARKKHQSEVSSRFWKNVDHKEHGRKISQVFASRTPEELAVVSDNIKASRTPEVRAKIGAATRKRMNDPVERFRHVEGAQSPEAKAKRKKSLKEFSNTDEGRELRRRAANIRWEKKRAEQLSNTFQGA